MSAPIESVTVLIMENFSVEYSGEVISGLPNSCLSYAGYRLERDGTTIRIEMVNGKASDSQVASPRFTGWLRL